MNKNFFLRIENIYAFFVTELIAKKYVARKVMYNECVYSISPRAKMECKRNFSSWLDTFTMNDTKVNVRITIRDLNPMSIYKVLGNNVKSRSGI